MVYNSTSNSQRLNSIYTGFGLLTNRMKASVSRIHLPLCPFYFSARKLELYSIAKFPRSAHAPSTENCLKEIYFNVTDVVLFVTGRRQGPRTRKNKRTVKPDAGQLGYK